MAAQLSSFWGAHMWIERAKGAIMFSLSCSFFKQSFFKPNAVDWFDTLQINFSCLSFAWKQTFVFTPQRKPNIPPLHLTSLFTLRNVTSYRGRDKSRMIPPVLSTNAWPLVCYSTSQCYYKLSLLLVSFNSLLWFFGGVLLLTTATHFIFEIMFQPLKDIATFHHVSFSGCSYTWPWYLRATDNTAELLTFYSRFSVGS